MYSVTESAVAYDVLYGCINGTRAQRKGGK